MENFGSSSSCKAFSKTILPFLSEEKSSGWTEFIFPLQNKKWKLNLEEFGSFLCQSLAFTQNVNSISLSEDDRVIFSVLKKNSKANLLKTKEFSGKFSPEKLFSLQDVHLKTLNFVVDFHDKQETKSISLDSIDGSLEVTKITNVRSLMFDQVLENAEIQQQMVRILKKQLPKRTRVRLLFNSLSSSKKHEETQER
jgi:hypothetical protein